MITYNGSLYPTRIIGGVLVSTNALLTAMSRGDSNFDKAGHFVAEKEKAIDEQISYYADEEEWIMPDADLYALIYDGEELPEDPEDDVIIIIEGGLVQEVKSTTGKLRITVVDRDKHSEDPVVMFDQRYDKITVAEMCELQNAVNREIIEQAEAKENFDRTDRTNYITV